MNNLDLNSVISFSINNINPIDFHHNNQTYSNSSNSVRTNNNILNNHPDSHLIRPIPKKVDLSKIMYQQMMDPYARPATNMNEVVHNNYLTFQKMYRDAMVSKTNGINNFSKQFQNSHSQFGDPRLFLNQYLSSKNGNCSSAMGTQFYSNTPNLPQQNMPTTNMDPYIFSNINHPISLRQNSVSYVSMNNMKETTIISDTQEDGLIDNHFSMSLNPNLKIRKQDSLAINSKQDRINKRPLKLQTKNGTEKPIKPTKRIRKSKTFDKYLDPLLQNNIQENSHTTCATPSDSSISPVSMVSCRSTITPQTFYPNFNNVMPTVQNQNVNNNNNNNNWFPTDTTEKPDLSSIDCPMNFKVNTKNEKERNTVSDAVIMGLPPKKRIKWQVENEEDKYVSESLINLNGILTTESTVGNNQTNLDSAGDDNKKTITDMTNSSTINLEDPLEAFRKIFLPMEKHPRMSDTESEDDTDFSDCKYQLVQKDSSNTRFADNNI